MTRTDKHEYKDGDIIYPGVTNVLADVGIIENNRFVTTERGKRMHLIIQLFIQGKLKFNDITQEEMELIEWFVNSIKDFEIIAVEQIIQNSVYHYAGTLDYLLHDKQSGITYVADLKTGIKKELWYKVQIAAYRNCIDIENINGLIFYQRTKSIELITENKLQQKYFPVFRSALDVYNFKRRDI